MGSQNRKKLNWLERNLPEGRVVDAGWFERHGLSRQLRRKYVLNGWLLTPARGVYRRPAPPDKNEPLAWQQLVTSLNDLLNLPVSVGGRTALELQGFTHYLTASGPREVHLYTHEDLPGWVSHVPVDAQLVVHNALRLFRHGDIPVFKEKTASSTPPPPPPAPPPAGASVIQRLAGGPWNRPLTMSLPERAILELLDEVPKRETFHQADVLMEGLRTLSPQRLHGLLLDCKNVKVKRLFFWFAERHNHAWLPKLDRSGIDLGKGKRLLVRGGKLDPKYNITVPENLGAGA
jgi:Transcriptional regulator, AbiEi antitoxin, Type IV TA system/Transcriptional regulator, AbiEi antitoxin N-terminal domain